MRFFDWIRDFFTYEEETIPRTNLPIERMRTENECCGDLKEHPDGGQVCCKEENPLLCALHHDECGCCGRCGCRDKEQKHENCCMGCCCVSAKDRL